MDSVFTGLIKLLSGEEIIGKILVCENENGFVIETPFTVEETIIETPVGEMVKVDLRPWAKFSNEEIFFVEKEKTITVYEADSRIEKIYTKSLRKYLNQDDTSQVDLTKDMGFKSKVQDARISLENIFKQS
tara:strand:+ start:820 stop:1212 length:393 start_codon:yes stop_codon:yes gene_type:complete